MSSAVSAESVKVEILGVSNGLRDNVAAHLSIVSESRRKRKKGETALTGDDIRRLHRSAAEEIERALQPFGYYAATVESTLDAPASSASNSKSGTRWTARYRIDPGPATLLRDIVIELQGEGQGNERLQRLIADADMQPGKVLQHPIYERLKNALQSSAYNLGYLDGGFRESKITVHPAHQSADVALVFDSGPQFQFGDVNIEQTILSQTFIDKFVEISAGEVFNPRRLIDLQLALSDSDYFQTTEVDVQRELASGRQVPVGIATTPAKPRRYDASLGYGTDTGARGRVGVLWRRVNQHGHRLRTDIRLSQIEQTAIARYTIPIGDVRSEYLDIIGDLDQREINDVDSRRYSIGTSLNQNRWDGRRRLSLRYQRESWNFGANPQQQSTLLIPGVEYKRIKADNLLFTRDGYSLSMELAGAAEGVLSDTSFMQGHLVGRFVSPLGKQGRLLLRAEYGATASDDFDALPPSQRFFAGGAQSVRGYGFEDLSPRDAQNNRVGGRYLGVASIEFDYLFYHNYGLALFIDAGNASDSPDIEPKYGAGVGFRYKTPIGMIRIDLAHPFDDPDSSFAFHISLGPDLQ
ncbi:MAG: autotransporter assembly complex family protein [Congregibacter sp.]